tara:strand:- start:3673 stop:3825 length:153 start_codon:yes stop_codon:yes gene_type:complete
MKNKISIGLDLNYDDLMRYQDVGADYFSLSTSLINPFKACGIINKSKYLI